MMGNCQNISVILSFYAYWDLHMKKSSHKIRTKYTTNQSEKRTTVKIRRLSDQSHEL